MKIRAQDGNGIFDFGSAFISDDGPGNVIWIQDKNENRSHFLGQYTDAARARGVLLDIEAAYCDGLRIFSMPLE